MSSIVLAGALAASLALTAPQPSGLPTPLTDASSSVILAAADTDLVGMAPPSYTLTDGLNAALGPPQLPTAPRTGAGNWSTGPRFGFAVVTGDTADQLEQAYGIGPGLSVFGWQFEHASPLEADGTRALVEVIPFAAGLEHGFKDVSLTVLFGARTSNGLEMLGGYYFSDTNLGVTFAVGKTFTVGRMQMPVHLAITDTIHGTKVSLTAGWNL